ncbi:MAG: hypothetical protein JWM18_1891, partial [Chloroflexi bacterium]|nr:hypothetical protein [Chloroflexota bacterium]
MSMPPGVLAASCISVEYPHCSTCARAPTSPTATTSHPAGLAFEMAADDHTLLAWLAAEVRREVPTLTDAEVKDLTIAVVRALLDNGLVEAGIPDGSGFRPEHTTSEELARRIAARWHLPAADKDDVQYSLWLSATSSGEALAKGAVDG